MTNHTSPSLSSEARALPRVGSEGYSASVLRRLTLAQDLDETLTSAELDTITTLGEMFSPVGTVDEVQSISLSLGLYRRKLTWARDQLASVEEAHQAGALARAELHARRDQLAVHLSKKIATLRRTCRGWLDEEDLRLLGFTSKTARLPVAVLEQSRKVTTGLDRLDAEIASDGWSSMKSWLKEQARALVPEISDLSRTLGEIEEQRQRARELTRARKAASEEFDSVYLRVGRVVEAILRMAGKESEADRVHPSTRQLDRKVDE